jgi:sugar lactone lactonase YvrE
LGDLFLAAGTPPFDAAFPAGEYRVFRSDGSSRAESFGAERRSYTSGCAVEPVTGHVWTTSFSGNTVSAFSDLHGDSGTHERLQTVDLRPHTFVNGRARGAVQSLVFDASGNILAGTVDGTNRVLKFTPAGAILDSFAMPGGRGVSWFDLAPDGRTIFYTSQDNVVRRYDLQTRQALPDFATLVDGTLHAIRLLPLDQGLLVAGSTYVTHLDMTGHDVAKLWLPARSFFALNITPDGRHFWTSTQAGELYRFDIASGTVVAGPIQTGAQQITGLCMKLEYTAAENVCRAAGPDGAPVETACPVF